MFPDRRPPGHDPLARNDFESWKRRQIAAARARVVAALVRNHDAEHLRAHLWPDSDESTRTVVGAVLVARAADLADPMRTSKAHRA